MITCIALTIMLAAPIDTTAHATPNTHNAPLPAAPTLHKLGRIPTPQYKRDAIPRFKAPQHPHLPAPPPAINWTTSSTTWPTDAWGNTYAGDCTCAALAAIIAEQTKCHGTETIINTRDVLDYYYKLTDGNDTGLDLVTALNAMQTTTLAGHKCGPYAALDVTNDIDVEQAIDLYGCAYLGIALPAAWDRDTSAWTVRGAYTRTVGGHCVVLMGYDPSTWYTYSWSQIIPMQRNALRMVCDEAYVPLTKAWTDPNDLAPSGFNTQTLTTDLAAFGTPIPPPTTTPPPPPTPKPDPCPRCRNHHQPNELRRPIFLPRLRTNEPD